MLLLLLHHFQILRAIFCVLQWQPINGSDSTHLNRRGTRLPTVSPCRSGTSRASSGNECTLECAGLLHSRLLGPGASRNTCRRNFPSSAHNRHSACRACLCRPTPKPPMAHLRRAQLSRPPLWPWVALHSATTAQGVDAFKMNQGLLRILVFLLLRIGCFFALQLITSVTSCVIQMLQMKFENMCCRNVPYSCKYSVS